MHDMLPFQGGEYIPAANLTILAVTYRGAIKGLNRYLVRFECCGAERTMSHPSLRKRIRAERVFCQHCGWKQRNLHQDDGLPQLMRAQAFLPADVLPAGSAWPRPGTLTPHHVWRAQA